ARSTGHIGSHTHTTRFTCCLRNSHVHTHCNTTHTRTAHHAATKPPFFPLQHPFPHRTRPRSRPQRTRLAPPQLHAPTDALALAHARRDDPAGGRGGEGLGFGWRSGKQAERAAGLLARPPSEAK